VLDIRRCDDTVYLPRVTQLGKSTIAYRGSLPLERSLTDALHNAHASELPERFEVSLPTHDDHDDELHETRFTDAPSRTRTHCERLKEQSLGN